MPFYTNESQQPCPACGFNVEWTYRLEMLAKMDAPHYAGDPSTASITSRQEYPVCRRCGYVHNISGAQDELQHDAFMYLEENAVDEEEDVEDSEAVPGEPEVFYSELAITTPSTNTVEAITKPRGRPSSK